MYKVLVPIWIKSFRFGGWTIWKWICIKVRKSSENLSLLACNAHTHHLKRKRLVSSEDKQFNQVLTVSKHTLILHIVASHKYSQRLFCTLHITNWLSSNPLHLWRNEHRVKCIVSTFTYYIQWDIKLGYWHMAFGLIWKRLICKLVFHSLLSALFMFD